MKDLLFLKALGLTEIEAACPECDCRFGVPISALDLPDFTLLSDIAALRTLPCPECDCPGIVVDPEGDPTRGASTESDNQDL